MLRQILIILSLWVGGMKRLWPTIQNFLYHILFLLVDRSELIRRISKEEELSTQNNMMPYQLLLNAEVSGPRNLGTELDTLQSEIKLFSVFLSNDSSRNEILKQVMVEIIFHSVTNVKASYKKIMYGKCTIMSKYFLMERVYILK